MNNHYPNPPAIGAVYPPLNHPVYGPRLPGQVPVHGQIPLPGPWPKICSLATKDVRFLLTKISSIMTELNRAALSGAVNEMVKCNLHTAEAAISVIEDDLAALRRDLQKAYAKAIKTKEADDDDTNGHRAP